LPLKPFQLKIAEIGILWYFIVAASCFFVWATQSSSTVVAADGAGQIPLQDIDVCRLDGQNELNDRYVSY